MNTPIRIQRKRVKGWKMPPNTVSVTRPGRFGNPFKLLANTIYFEYEPNQWRRLYSSGFDGAHSNHDVVKLFSELLFDTNSHPELRIVYARDKIKKMSDRIFDLSGKNLACFCASEPCHASILISLANH